MSSFDKPYRPRSLTKDEVEKEQERARQAQERVIKRARKEQAQHEERTTDFHHSGVSGIAYKDFKLGRGAPVKSRALLDAQAYAARQKDDEGELLDAVPRLSSCCLRVLVDNHGEPGVFDALDPVRHRVYAGPLLGALERRAATGALPFQVWLDFAHRFALDLPAPRRTYRGLCVSDAAELSLLKELNAEAVERCAQETSYPPPSGRDPLVPPFYLAYLDLRGDTTFTDGDIYKLRNPLSHFLAVLRLDGTGVTDEALVWIARAAEDPPQYAQLQVLSLRGLLTVTDLGVLRLVGLPSLRSIDLRGTNCTPSLRGALNSMLLSSPSTSQQRFWRPPRPRPDLPPSLPFSLEAQLFEPSNYAPSRVLATLHYLARIDAAPPGIERKATARARRLDKPLGVHLTSISRTAAPLAAVPKAEQSAEELYRAQLALSYGAKHAAHHSAFGSVTSTVPLSREAVEDEGRREGDRGAAFRNRNDAVAAGEYIGAGGRTGGRAAGTASLYDVGQRRVSSAQREMGAREPFSDSEGEDEREAVLDAEDREARARWTEENARRGTFFRRVEPPQPRGPRTFADPPPSDLMLLRHVPYVPPWEGLPLSFAASVEHAGTHEQPTAAAGGGLVKKRQRPLFDAPTPSPAPARTPARAPPPAPSSTPSGNPFSKRQASSSSSSSAGRLPARSASKNIVRTAPALPQRSALAAFRTKK
ncbi:hypothetical protein JCM10450v2_003551 [Rhodotorula kratochvilovae]